MYAIEKIFNLINQNINKLNLSNKFYCKLI